MSIAVDGNTPWVKRLHELRHRIVELSVWRNNRRESTSLGLLLGLKREGSDVIVQFDGRGFESTVPGASPMVRVAAGGNVACRDVEAVEPYSWDKERAERVRAAVGPPDNQTNSSLLDRIRTDVQNDRITTDAERLLLFRALEVADAQNVTCSELALNTCAHPALREDMNCWSSILTNQFALTDGERNPKEKFVQLCSARQTETKLWLDITDFAEATEAGRLLKWGLVFPPPGTQAPLRLEAVFREHTRHLTFSANIQDNPTAAVTITARSTASASWTGENLRAFRPFKSYITDNNIEHGPNSIAIQQQRTAAHLFAQAVTRLLRLIGDLLHNDAFDQPTALMAAIEARISVDG